MAFSDISSKIKSWDQTSSSSEELFEDLKVQLRPAPFLKRSLAFIVDTSILGAVAYIVMVVVVVIFMVLAAAIAGLNNYFGQTGSLIGVSLLIIVIVLLTLASLGMVHAYFIYFEYKKGQTPGKKVMGLRVISLDRRALTLNQAIWREMIRYIDLFLFIPGLISVAVTQKSQRIGDLVANTMVVHSESKEKDAEFLYLNQDAFLKWAARLRVKEYSTQFAEEYLKFAFPRLITRKFILSANDLEDSFNKLEQICDNLREAITAENSEELLRFFAEHARQRLER